VYLNVLKRSIDTEGKDWWEGQLGVGHLWTYDEIIYHIVPGATEEPDKTNAANWIAEQKQLKSEADWAAAQAIIAANRAAAEVEAEPTETVKDVALANTTNAAIHDYFENDSKKTELYYSSGKLHRVGGPAEIHYYENGNIRRQVYWENDIKTRTT